MCERTDVILCRALRLLIFKFRGEIYTLFMLKRHSSQNHEKENKIPIKTNTTSQNNSSENV